MYSVVYFFSHLPQIIDICIRSVPLLLTYMIKHINQREQ